MLSLSLSRQAEAWLEEYPDRQLVSDVATWIRDVLCDEDAEIESLTIESPWGRRFEVTELVELGVVVCWFEAAPFRTIKVMWIKPVDDDEDMG